MLICERRVKTKESIMMSSKLLFYFLWWMIVIFLLPLAVKDHCKIVGFAMPLLQKKNPKPPGYSELVHAMLHQSSQQPEEVELQSSTAKQHESSKSNVIDQNGRNLNQQNNSYQQKTKKIQIHFDTSPIESTLSILTDKSLLEVGREVIDKVLPTIRNQFQEAISIKPNYSTVLSDTVCFDLFSEYFDDRRKRYNNADVVIFVSAFDEVKGDRWCNSNDPFASTLAAAAPCNLHFSDNRPNVGFINVCLNAIQSRIQLLEDVGDIMSHEILHILILSTDLFKFYRNGIDGTPLTPRNRNGSFDLDVVKCVDGTLKAGYPTCENTIAIREETVVINGLTEKRPYYEITLPTVRQVVRNQFNCQNLQGARLENQPTNPQDCTGSHFDERFFFSNLMSAFYIFGSAHFSPLLLALMEDSGWYKANYNIAENGSFGLNAGCDFVKKDCIVNGNVPDYSEGYFCNDFSSRMHCGPTRNYYGRCDVSKYTSSSGRNYFDSILTGPTNFLHADWCPVVHLDRHFCSEDSTCIEFSIDSTPTAGCVKSFCENEAEQFIFKVGDSFYPCNVEDTGRTVQTSWNGKIYEFVCPNLNQVCPEYVESYWIF